MDGRPDREPQMAKFTVFKRGCKNGCFERKKVKRYSVERFFTLLSARTS